jgi:hypothetical protein
MGEFHDQGGAKWKVIRGQLSGHNDTSANPGQPISRLGVGRLQGIFGGLSYF